MLRILVAEDSPSARLFLETIMADYGRVESAVDGAQAVELFQQALDAGEPHHVVVLDIMMPVMDGLSALIKIQEIGRERGLDDEELPKSIMASCLTDPDHMMRAHYECGADVYLTKPYTQQTLEEALVNLGLIANPLGEMEEL
ncbi:MAG: two-component system, chemotaxis family, chemotaxis protein CheY [Desulfovibrionales bacterium]|jgi:two-component system chemotaxis response regulator CheY|nr:two-component system, chemotaxis family, chemotaxis protein CheY [Desulfovibrionales bacterium]